MCGSRIFLGGVGGLRDNVFRGGGAGGEAHLSGISQREFQKMVPDNQQLCVSVCVSVVCVCVVGGGVNGSVPPIHSRSALVLNEEIILSVVKQHLKVLINLFEMRKWKSIFINIYILFAFI